MKAIWLNRKTVSTYWYLHEQDSLMGTVLGLARFRLESIMIGDHLEDLVIVSQTVLHTFPAYVAEFIGTFFLVFTVGLNVSMQNPNAPLSIGSILMVMIFSMGR